MRWSVFWDLIHSSRNIISLTLLQFLMIQQVSFPFVTAIGVNSSFNPNNHAVIYATPSEINGFSDYTNSYSTLNNRNQVRNLCLVQRI